MNCQVHAYHWPRVTQTDVHHIWPKGDGGPDEAWNKVTVCPTGHRNIHEALTALRRGLPVPKVTRKELELAQRGWSAIKIRMAGGVPPREEPYGV